jgi:hypothetical protein
MSDRELLELAAKAAGYWNIRGAPCPWVGDTWNPLKDDGDALRLAVKLGLWITIDDKDEMTADVLKAVSGPNGERPTHFIERFKYPQYGDRYTATRRAITRAAAEIGKANNA